MAAPEWEAAAIEAKGQPVPFDFRGQTFHVAPALNQFALLELTAGDGTDERAAASAFFEFLKVHIHGDDWPRFRRFCLDNAVDTDGLVEVVKAIMEALSGRPTGPRSVSAPGLRPTGEGSTPPSFMRDTEQIRAV